MIAYLALLVDGSLQDLRCIAQPLQFGLCGLQSLPQPRDLSRRGLTLFRRVRLLSGE